MHKRDDYSRDHKRPPKKHMKTTTTSTMFPPPASNQYKDMIDKQARVVTLGSNVTPSSVGHSPQVTSIPSPFAATGIAIGYTSIENKH